MKKILSKTILPAIGLALISSSQATLIAHYDFTDGDLLDNEVGATYTLAHNTLGIGDGSGVTTINPDGSAAFSGSETNKGYLETDGPGGLPDFTVSFWWKTNTFAQGNYQGIFSNDDTKNNFTWQFDSSGTNMRLVSQNNTTLTYPESSLSTDTWYHTVIRKEDGAGDNYTQVYITEEGAAGPALVMNQNANPGGIFEFRLGTIRDNSNLLNMDMANVKIYSDSDVDLDVLLAEGPQLVPEPSSALLIGLAGLSLLIRRKR